MTAVLFIIALIEAFVILGMFIYIRLPNYDGKVVVYDNGEKKTFSLEVDGDLDTLDQQKSILLKVAQAPE